MAETKQNKPQREMVKIQLKRAKPGQPQEEFFSINFENYLVKRGEWVEVPKEIADMIEENEALEREADNYSAAQQSKIQ